MDHGSMDMPTQPNATTPRASSMSMGDGSGCKISMLWNYNTIGSCFISSSWKITSNGMFAGSLIGVILLVVLLEFLRRAVKEYDRYLIRTHKARYVDADTDAETDADAVPHAVASSSSHGGRAKGPSASTAAIVRSTPAAAVVPPFRPSASQQAIRAFIHVCQFTVAYFVMLLAMYYNGYMIFCIFIGAYVGAYIFQWETLLDEPTSAAREATVCCG